MDMTSDYHVPLSLTVLAGIFLALGAICMLIVAGDIIWRRGWESMMWIMIPVYIINAGYMGPLTLYLYFKYGRPSKPVSSEMGQKATGHCHKPTDPEDLEKVADHDLPDSAPHSHHEAHRKGHDSAHHEAHHESHHDSHQHHPTPSTDPSTTHDHHAHHHHHHSSRPLLATILIGVSHCGAGCVLGDLVGEWLVYGAQPRISGQTLWPELLIDYGFALLFGIAFQYFSIAPMAGEWGPRSVWRAAKADVLSLTSFEVGAFGWMVAYQAGIWDYRLDMTTWAYWWMMQVGMLLGFGTAVPVNWWLIGKGIKEPCA
ncbi:MAG: hypothetical protein M1822_009175 [Bathelium mastoideum]|nr:MAG: hypothetical protein M1822_009175 [Bathelium mastoideum]